MFSDDEEEPGENASQGAHGTGPTDSQFNPTVEELLRDYDALLRKRGVGPGYLKRRLRQMRISEQKITTCHTRTELIELLLFADIPVSSSPGAPPKMAAAPDAVWAAVLLLIVGMCMGSEYCWP